jgi:hypothetical protein
MRAWLAPARVHHLSGGLAQCTWLCVTVPRASAPITAAGLPRIDRVEKNEACFRAQLMLRGGFGVIGT